MNTNDDQQHDQAAQFQTEPPLSSFAPPRPPMMPQEEPDADARPMLGAVAYSALFTSDGRDASELASALLRPVWIDALGKEGAIRILKISEEMKAQERIFAEDEAAADAGSAQNEVARRAARNRRRILLALELCAVSPSFTAEEARAAIEAPEGSLVALPIFNAAALANSIFQLEPLEDAAQDGDPLLAFVKGQARAVAILQSEKAAARLNSTLAQSRFDMAVSAAVKPALDLAELITDLLTSRRLDLLDRLEAALEARNTPDQDTAPSAPTAALVMAHSHAAQAFFKEGA